ncbi:transposase [Streptomyces sp. NPDC017529]|uniref:transposase n=1 Tax=Streptomyces sp. NPDC017529 TaxID=3365000 RepID=UPI003791539F
MCGPLGAAAKAGPARSTVQQAPRHHRRSGRPARGVADRRQPQRRHTVAAVAGEDPGCGRRRRPPQRRPDVLLADRGYDPTNTAAWCDSAGSDRSSPNEVRNRSGTGQEHGSGLGIFRYAVERAIAWLHGFRRLRTRWERRDAIHKAFLGLATCLITHRHVQRLR